MASMTRRPWPILTLMGLATILALLLLASPALALEGIPRVVDGDSLIMSGQRIRLVGIDAPEFSQRCTKDGNRWRCGQAAKNALRRFLDGRMAHCQSITRDRYNRMVARCQVGGEDIGAWMVRQGWALDYRKHSDERYAAEEAEARAARRGLWAGEFVPPWVWQELQR